MNVRFVVTKPESKRKTFSVQLPILVGRSEEAKFRIQQDRVSRKHCEFFAQDGGVYVRDLGSTNGTFLNGELIEASVKVPLEPGAIVRVGSLEFRVEFSGVEPTPARVAAPVPGAVDDRTVELVEAADAEQLQIEHVAEAPGGRAILTAERPAPADEPLAVEAVQQPPPAAGQEEKAAGSEAPPQDKAFGFLAGSDDSAPAAADDDQLGDFLKGLK